LRCCCTLLSLDTVVVAAAAAAIQLPSMVLHHHHHHHHHIYFSTLVATEQYIGRYIPALSFLPARRYAYARSLLSKDGCLSVCLSV